MFRIFRTLFTPNNGAASAPARWWTARSILLDNRPDTFSPRAMAANAFVSKWRQEPGVPAAHLPLPIRQR
jgi:hypothetical protein